jgi:hypothetical protein
MLLEDSLSGAAIKQAGADPVLHGLRQSRSMQVFTAMDRIAMCICVVRMPDGKAHDVWVQVRSAGCELGQTAALA